MTDIAIEHTRKCRKGGASATFLMHPYENVRGDGAGKYEILRDIVESGQLKRKRSIHVTLPQLAELYARSITETFDIRLRLRPAEYDYPTAPPGKKVPARFIRPGSDFDCMVKRIDISEPVTADLKKKLAELNIRL